MTKHTHDRPAGPSARTMANAGAWLDDTTDRIRTRTGLSAV